MKETLREDLIELIDNVAYHQRLYPDVYVDYLIDNGVTIQKEKQGKWKLNNDGSGTCNQCRFTQSMTATKIIAEYVVQR